MLSGETLMPFLMKTVLQIVYQSPFALKESPTKSTMDVRGGGTRK